MPFLSPSSPLHLHAPCSYPHLVSSRLPLSLSLSLSPCLSLSLPVSPPLSPCHPSPILLTPLLLRSAQHCAAAEELLVSDDQFARWEGAEVNVQNEFGFTSLALAAKYGHTPMVRLLLSYGAAIDARNVDGFTALILASEAGHVPMVRLLTRRLNSSLTHAHEWTAPPLSSSFEGHFSLLSRR